MLNAKKKDPKTLTIARLQPKPNPSRTVNCMIAEIQSHGATKMRTRSPEIQLDQRNRNRNKLNGI